ncbi:hypothetical protein AALC75_01855 [Lachnospiraceae bacterium 48-42]|nr:hypothetical protein [Dorea sp.]
MSSRIQISNGIEISVNNKEGMRRRLDAYAGNCRGMSGRGKKSAGNGGMNRVCE